MMNIVSIDYVCCCCEWFFFFKQKTAYEMRISDWSSDVCSSDLPSARVATLQPARHSPRDHRHASGGDLCLRCGGPRALVQPPRGGAVEIGRASCRERGCQYV